MPIRTSRRTTKLMAKAAELAIAAPQVMAHRAARMAAAGAVPSARDRKEFQRMSDEKSAAFRESWIAMGMEALRANQALTAAWFRMFWSPESARGPAAKAMTREMQSAALGVLSKGMAPVHRRAVANAKRLARTKTR